MQGSAIGSNAKRRVPAIALPIFLLVVVGHWTEHLVQAFQHYVLGRPAAASLGALGAAAPGLVASEWLHWVYNGALLAGIVWLRPTFGRLAGRWWMAALLAQAWHAAEHTLLLGQAVAGRAAFGGAVPTSVGQLLLPRLELHLIYNTVVTGFLVLAFVAARRRVGRSSLSVA